SGRRIRARPGDLARLRRGKRRPDRAANRERTRHLICGQLPGRAPADYRALDGEDPAGRGGSAAVSSPAPRVLVVDAEPQIVRGLKIVLRSAGYAVEAAETKEEALALLATRPPDALVLDLVLPDGRGSDVCREVRQWSKLPILMLSAVGDEREKVRALD